MRNQLRLLIVLFSASIFITSCSAFAETYDRDGVRNRPVKRSVVQKSRQKGRTPYRGSVRTLPVVPVSDSRPLPQLTEYGVSTPSSSSTVKVVVKDPVAPSRLVHFRLQTVPLLQWMAQSETMVSLRADADLIVSDRFSFGPSVIYNRKSVQDMNALAGGQSVGFDTTRLELGLLGNIFVTGNTSTGGFLFRPHVYWVSASGQRDTDTAGTAGTATDGVRTGAEFLFQKVLDVGFSFEVGGGFTYHVVPWQVSHAGAQSVGPDNNVEPIVTVGIGWAF